MEEAHVVSAGYEVPTYDLRSGEAWFHFLHGNVPGHQIDFIYRPKVPQGPLTRQHFSHLSRLMKYIEPRHGHAFAFEIGNLSRDDTQYEPGRGGIALIFGLRIKGATDHAGRQDPPFCHSAVLVDRHLDGEAIYAAATQFYQKLLPDEESRAEGSGWYHTYVQYAQNPDALVPLLKGYLADFEDLYTPPPSGLTFRWSVEGSTPPRRVVIVYPDRADFASIAYCMARIASVLVESDIKWTAISNGREQDVVGGLTVRFVPQREASAEASDVVLMYMEQVPESPAEIAAQLFNARDVSVGQASAPRPGWRQGQEPAVTPPSGKSENGAGATINMSRGNAAPAKEDRARPWSAAPEAAAAEGDDSKAAGLGLINVVEKAPDAEGMIFPQPDLAAELKRKQRKQQFSTLIGVGMLIVLMGVIAAVWFGSAPTVPV
ncbi:MAG: hypothetical protein HUU21_13385, partial [Polyangiaceae bacterium]|nr:hypothetical protein [Polyangiaceae bacterium]